MRFTRASLAEGMETSTQWQNMRVAGDGSNTTFVVFGFPMEHTETATSSVAVPRLHKLS